MSLVLQCRPHRLAASLWALSQLAVSDRSVLMLFLKAAAHSAPSFSSKDAINCLCAVATLGLAGDPHIQPLVDAAKRTASSFDASEAINCLSALVSLGVHESELLQQTLEVSLFMYLRVC
jgi:hypothetical protein